ATAEPDEDIRAVVGGARGRPAPARAAASAPAVAAPSPASVVAAPAPSRFAAPAPSLEPAMATAAAVLPTGRLRVSPLARKLAQRASIDLTRVTGTGPGGGIIPRERGAVRAGRPAAPAGPPTP